MSALGPVIGVDFGTARTGIAVSDALGISARPHGVVPTDGGEVTAIVELVEEFGAHLVVVGLPRTLAGREGSAAEGARGLAERLTAALEVPVEFADERYTTARAEEILRATVRDRRERRTKVDAVAASVMLQGWLDARAARARGNPRYSPD